MTSEASADEERYVRLSVNFFRVVEGWVGWLDGVGGGLFSPPASAFEHFVVSYSFFFPTLLWLFFDERVIFIFIYMAAVSLFSLLAATI
jgi:hypothetical protein